MAEFLPDNDDDAGTPRWVKVFGIIFIVLVLLLVILHLTGNSLGGPHGHILPIELGVYQL